MGSLEVAGGGDVWPTAEQLRAVLDGYDQGARDVWRLVAQLLRAGVDGSALLAVAEGLDGKV